MYQKICTLDDLLIRTGVPALLGDEQIAIFRLTESTDQIYAVSNWDPFCEANVISRGITCEIQGITAVASPMYKQHFSLQTGICIEDEKVSLKTYPLKVEGQNVMVKAD